MTERFIVAQYQDSFPDEVAVKTAIKAIVISRDNQRPQEKRFEVSAYDRATPITLTNGAQLLKVADLAFVFAPNRQAGFNLFGSGKGMYFSKLEEAKEWVAELDAMAPGAWAIFEQVPPI